MVPVELVKISGLLCREAKEEKAIKMKLPAFVMEKIEEGDKRGMIYMAAEL